GRGLDDHYVVELETLRLPRRQHRDRDLVEQLALRQVARERAWDDHREQPVLPGQRGGLAQRRRKELLRVHQDEARRIAALAVGERRLDLRRDPVEQRQREVHDLGRDAVGVAQLLDLHLRLVRQIRLELLPAAVDDGSGRLRDVAEDRERAVYGAARDREQLHRREILRLVDDHVPVGPRRAGEQRPRLVEQRHVLVAPAQIGHATGPVAQQELPLVVVQHFLRRRLERGRRREEPRDELLGLRQRQDAFEPAREEAAAPQRPLELVEAAQRARAEQLAVALVEAAEHGHPEPIARKPER